MIRNPTTLRQRLADLRGSPVELDLSRYDQPLAEIGELGKSLMNLWDGELRARWNELRESALAGAPEESLRVPGFALAREAARRAVGLRPYDVQVVAALAMQCRHVVEMQTGEGKTLAAVLPACLNALTGKGVHVLTFNDYLARRDAEWMGPVYRSLGLSVTSVAEGATPGERRRAYRADVTYVTAKEAGFDYLRDLRANDLGQRVHRPFHFALVDEADSLLIDEARIPLVLAGTAARRASSARRLAGVVADFEAGREFELADRGRSVELTDSGLDRAEAALGCGDLLAPNNYSRLTELNCALHAHALLERDVDYIVREGRIDLVDEFTGRVVEDRQWPDGLQAALEAKEGLARTADGRILGSITLQHFLSAYPRLCGMTGTAQDAAGELEEVYGLRVTVVPTHRSMVRVDRPDVVYPSRPAKEHALVEEIRRVLASGRPVLVGTLTVEESERLGRALREAGISCEILNARNDAREAEIVARAGGLGAVTISTNMAGRGTDILLGGADGADRQEVVQLGGLYVIATNRHDSRRVDLQLRGRAGRQGDPGESRFFLSLEDDLLARHGLERLVPAALRQAPNSEADPAGHAAVSTVDVPVHQTAIDNPLLRREIARAQRIVEGHNRELRKTLWNYSEPIEDQRRIVFEHRQGLLEGKVEPRVWRQQAEAHAGLVAVAGGEATRRAEVAVTLADIDRRWSEHLARVDDLREASHLVGLGGDDPLTHFKLEAARHFRRMRRRTDEAVLEALPAVRVDDGEIDLGGLGLDEPLSTWTYLVNDDPFRDQLGRMLTGPGNTTLAIGAALFAPLYFLLWLMAERFLRRRARHGRSPVAPRRE